MLELVILIMVVVVLYNLISGQKVEREKQNSKKSTVDNVSLNQSDKKENNIAEADSNRINKLSEIGKLYKDGVITEEEFNKLKQEIIK